MFKRQKPRNPFAAQTKSGAGFHSKTKYSKKDRRATADEINKWYAEQEENKGGLVDEDIYPS